MNQEFLFGINLINLQNNEVSDCHEAKKDLLGFAFELECEI